MLIKLYETSSDADMKEHILNYLSMSPHPQAVEKVLAIARSDPNKDIQKRALDYVAMRPNSFDTWSPSLTPAGPGQKAAYPGLPRDVPRSSSRTETVFDCAVGSGSGVAPHRRGLHRFSLRGKGERLRIQEEFGVCPPISRSLRTIRWSPRELCLVFTFPAV